MAKRIRLAPGTDPRLQMLLDDPALYFAQARERANATAGVRVSQRVKATGLHITRGRSHA